MSNELVKDSKSFYPQIRAVLGAEGAPDAVLDTAVAYCQAAGLDIMRKPVAIISYGGKSQIVFTIQAITTIASRAGWSGSDEIVYGPMIKHGAVEVPEWGSQVVYKMIGGQRCPFTGPRVYFRERAQTNQNWTKQPMAMFNKCILAAALRVAFPEALAHAMEEDEVYQPIVQVDNSGIEALRDKPVATPVVAEVIEPVVSVEKPEATEEDLAVILNAMSECKTQAELDDVRAVYGDAYKYNAMQKSRLKKAVELKKEELK